MRNKVKYHVIYKYMIVVGILVFCECFFFRNILLHSELLISDRGDGRLTNLLVEHWWNFVIGRESFSEIAIFYPAEHVFGYTDLFLGYGILYSILRLIGFNMYVSYKWTLIMIHTIGTFSMYHLLEKKLGLKSVWAIFGTMAFAFSPTLARHLGHTQLMAVSYLPILLILIIGFCESFNSRLMRNIYAYSFICMFVLLTYTSWYVACFSGIFSLFFCLIYCTILALKKTPIFGLIRRQLMIVGKDLIGYCISVVVLYIPFISIYAPVMKSTAGYSYGDCKTYLPDIIDFFNVGESNLLLGKVIERLGYTCRGELSEGFSIVLLLAFVFFYIKYVKRYINNFEGSELIINELVNAACLTVFVCCLCIIRIGDMNLSLWKLVYTFLPIVRSVRAVARFMLWLSFPISVLTAYMANKCFDSRDINNLISVGICLLLFVSNINECGVTSGWSEKEEIDFINNVETPPANIEAFYIVDSDNTCDAPYIYQLDSFEIANKFSIKTINGYSGQFPEKWGGIWEVCSKSYETCIYDWVYRYNLQNVYAYDRARNDWIPLETRQKDWQYDDVFSPVDDKFSISTGLEDWNQGEFAWTSDNFKTTIENSRIEESGLNIRMEVCLDNYMAQNPNIEPYIQIFLDGDLKREVDVTNGIVEINIPVDNHESDLYEVSIKTNCYFNPKVIGINNDKRNLSLAMYYIGD